MGRPYANEMALLPTTYAWALSTDIEEFAIGVREAASRPLVVVGSGGSLTAAHHAADLHQRVLGQLARVMTPYEVVAFGGPPRGSAVLMFSAGGRNTDIRGALEVCLKAEPDVLVLVTGSEHGPAAQRARAARFPMVASYELPSGRDGFLATNSLLAFVVLSSRAYAAAGVVEELPAWPMLIGDEPLGWLSRRDGTTQLNGAALLDSREASSAVSASAPGEARTLVVLHGLDTRAAAIDLESKCTEAALATVQLADYRNFAHGRHHWLAKRPATVLTLESPADVRLAERTIAQLPTDQPVARMCTRHEGVAGGIEALARVMHLVGTIGDVVGIDPGRPGVPDFGGKLYSLPIIRHASPRQMELLPEAERLALFRKTGRSAHILSKTGTLTAWREGYSAARAALVQATFGAVVFDYDGTVVDRSDRFHGPRPEVVRAIEGLLRAHVPVGIATGRGRSAGNELRDRLAPELWERVLMGYYNGGELAPLGAHDAPNGTADVGEALQSALSVLLEHPLLNAMADITPRRPQITVEPRDQRLADDVWRLVSSALVGEAGHAIRVVRSSHSIDVLAPDVSKLRLVREMRLRFRIPEPFAILSVGDRGQWPGNDAEMLASSLAVTVDEASADPGHAWPWAPPGSRGVAATLALCSHFVFSAPTTAEATHATFRVAFDAPAAADPVASFNAPDTPEQRHGEPTGKVRLPARGRRRGAP